MCETNYVLCITNLRVGLDEGLDNQGRQPFIVKNNEGKVNK